MSLKRTVSKEEFEALGDNDKIHYKEVGDRYKLDVDGEDDGKELKEALRKEREERASAKKRLAELEEAQREAEAKRQQEKGEFEALWKKEQEKSATATSELQKLRDRVANGLREQAALEVAGTLTKDMKRAALLKKEALLHIVHTDDGVKINGPDGDAWTAEQLKEYLAEQYPFLADGSQASGGGATGGKGGGATTKKFNEYSGAELSEIRQKEPEKYQRLKDDFYNK